SQARLRTAIGNTGASLGEFEPAIERAANRMAHFGRTDDQTKEALATLVNATHNTRAALGQMQAVADLAAAKHLSLADAATMVAKVDVGKGAKTLAMFGISSKDAEAATKALAKATAEVEQSAAAQAKAEEH